MKLTQDKGRAQAIVISAATVGCLAWLLRIGSLPIETFLLAWTVIVVGMQPMMAWLRRGRSTLPVFELICISFSIHMGLGAIIQPNVITIFNVPQIIEWRFINQSLILSLIGMSTLVLVFIATRAWCFKAVPFAVNLRIVPHRRKTLILCLTALALAVAMLTSLGWNAPGAIGALLSGQAAVASCCAAIFYYRLKDQNRWFIAVMILGTTYLSVTGLNTGMLEAAALPLVGIFIIRISCLREFPSLVAALLLTGLLILNSSKSEYRAQVWSDNANVGTVEKLRVWYVSTKAVSLGDFFTAKSNESGLEEWRLSLARFSLINRFAWVCSSTPDRVPFLIGTSYFPFIYAWIPRVIWPNKPSVSDVASELDVTYEQKMEGGSQTIGIGFIAEAYANFSWYGVVVIMGLLGTFLAFLDRLLNQSSSEGGGALYVVALSPLLNGIGSAAVTMFGNILPMLLAAVLIIVPFCVRIIDRETPHYRPPNGPRLGRKGVRTLPYASSLSR